MNKPTEKIAAIIAAQVQSVCDWDDRTSPDDYPDHLLITADELKMLFENVTEAALSAALAVEAGTVGYAAIHAHTVRQAAARADEEGNEHIAERLRDAMRFIENSAITTSPPPTMPGTVGVKPLEWKQTVDGRYSNAIRPDHFTAENYTVKKIRSGWVIDDGRFTFLRKAFPSDAAAKAAAQADYEARILSAIVVGVAS